MGTAIYRRCNDICKGLSSLAALELHDAVVHDHPEGSAGIRIVHNFDTVHIGVDLCLFHGLEQQFPYVLFVHHSFLFHSYPPGFFNDARFAAGIKLLLAPDDWCHELQPLH